MTGTKGSFGLEALAKIRTNRLALNDIAVGLLFGLDANGKIIPADRSTNVKAVGIVSVGSEYVEGSAREFNKDDELRSGKSTDAEVYMIVNMPNSTFTNAQIGNVLYLDTAGGFTLTPTTTIGETLQRVGKVHSRASVQLDLTHDPEGTVVTASNFDVVEVSADGAIATSGIALVTTGAGALNATLGAPTPQTQVRIKVVTDGGGNLIVTTGAGITFDATNNTATFADGLDELVLGYKSATEWIIIENVGAVALSAV